MLKSIRILRRVLESEETCCFSEYSEWSPASVVVKRFARSKMMMKQYWEIWPYKLYTHKPESVPENVTYKILQDFEFQMEHNSGQK